MATCEQSDVEMSWITKIILKLYKEYGNFAKLKSRKVEKEEMKRCILRDSLEDNFDIALYRQW